MKLGVTQLSNLLDRRSRGTTSTHLLLLGSAVIGLVWTNGASAAHRLPIQEVLTDRAVEVRIQGKNSITSIAAILTKRTDEGTLVVIPPGTYFAPESKSETEDYWSTDEITFPFLISEQCSLDVPVVKYVLKPGCLSTNTQLFVLPPPTDKVPRLLDFIVKNAMSHEAKQLAVGILHDPSLTRDDIDGMYYTRHSGFTMYTEEAVGADDPIHAFMALKHIGVSADLLKLHGERVSLVHALGSSDDAVRQFALSALVELGALDKTFNDSRDCRKALLHFLKHRSRSVRHRAVLGLQRDPGDEVVRALLPLLTDETAVYAFQSIFRFDSTSRTIHDAVITTLRGVRDKNEDILLPLLESADFKERLAGIELFQGSEKPRVKAMLRRLTETDEYKQVRDAAEKALTDSK